MSVLKFWSYLLYEMKVGSAGMKRVCVRRQGAGCFSSNLNKAAVNTRGHICRARLPWDIGTSGLSYFPSQAGNGRIKLCKIL